MKNSIKRAQSQACLGFAEQKNFRPLAKLKKLTMTLALLITAATGAWASGEIVVTVTAADLQADLSNPFTKNGVTIKCSDRMSGGVAFNELNEMSTTLGYFTKIEITNQYPEGISEINGINGFSVNGSVATWTGKASSVGLGHYSVGPVVQFVFTIEPAGIDVTYNDAHTEASFTMPQYDVTATYTLKRDMTVDVDGEMADRIRIQMVDNAFQAVDATQMNPVVKDNLETVTLTETTDYTLQLQKQSETDETVWTDVTALSVGNFRYKITGAGNYSGICYSEEFALFQGYEIKVAAGEYATFYKDEPLYADTETSADAVLYTISSVSADKAVLSSAITTAPSLTPLLVFNSSEETKTFLLIPADAEPNLDLTVGTNEHGTVTFKVGENAVTSAKEGDQVTVTVTPNTGYAVDEATGKWYAAVANSRRIPAGGSPEIGLLSDITLTAGDVDKTTGAATYTFTMERANAQINVTYKHRHVWDFSVVDGNILKAVCQNQSGDCDIEVETTEIALPEELVYGRDCEASVDLEAFNEALGGEAEAELKSVTYKGTLLNGGDAYGPTTEAPTLPGEYTVTVTVSAGNQDYTFSRQYTLSQKVIDNMMIQPIADCVYDGQLQSPDIVVKYGDRVLTLGTDYVVRYSENVNAGVGIVTVYGLENYAGVCNGTFNILPKELSADMPYRAIVLTFEGRRLEYQMRELFLLLGGEQIRLKTRK